MPCKSVLMYSAYYNLANELPPPEVYQGTVSFGLWTSREYYSEGVGEGNDNDLNSFDHRIRAVRVFTVFNILLGVIVLIFATDRLFRRFAGPNRSETDEDDWCKWAHISMTGFQFYSVLVSSWLYSSLIHINSTPWTFAIMCLNVGVTGLIGCVVVNAEINNPDHDPESGKIVMRPRVLFIVAIALSFLTIVFSLACLMTYRDPTEEVYEKKTSLMILVDSFKSHGYKTALLSFFITDALANAAGIALLFALIYLKNPQTVYVILIVTMEVIYIRYAAGLVSIWIMSRAPALTDFRVLGGNTYSCFVIDIIKFILSNAIVILVIFGVVNPEKLFEKMRRPHLGSEASLDNLKSKKGKIWKEKNRDLMSDYSGNSLTVRRDGSLRSGKKGKSKKSKELPKKSSDLGFESSEENEN